MPTRTPSRKWRRSRRRRWRIPRSCRTCRTAALNWEPVVAILFFAVIIAVMWRMLKVMPKVKPQQIKPASHQAVGWKDIAGVDDARGELEEIVEFLRDPEAVRRAGREGAEGDPAARAAGDGQDAAGEGGRARVRRAVLRAVGGGVRGDVRRPRRRAHPPAVRDRPQARTGDHLHRRARRGRRPPRDGHLRREGPDAQPIARRDGRLRRERARGRDRGVEPARQARPGAAAPGALRPPGVRRAAGREGPRRRARRAHAREAAGQGRPRPSWPSRRAA